jgi:hypothetical protein
MEVFHGNARRERNSDFGHSTDSEFWSLVHAGIATMSTSGFVLVPEEDSQ